MPPDQSLDPAQRRALLARLEAEIERQHSLLAQDRPTQIEAAATNATAKWCDEQTQHVPLSPPAANLATDVEVDIELGGKLWSQRESLDRRILHWMSDHVLLATIDTSTWQLGVRKLVAKDLLGDTKFVGRPDGAHIMPDGFRAVSLFDVFWNFGLFGQSAVERLPRRFLTDPMELRRMPDVSAHLLAPRHRHMLRLLARHPMTFDTLQEALAANRDDLLHDIAALYYTRAVGTIKPQVANWALRSFKGLIRPADPSSSGRS